LREPGYAIEHAVFSPAEIGHVKAELEREPLNRSRAGARHILATRSVAALATDERLMELASRWLGCRAVPFKATLFDKSPTANWLVAWHQDTALPVKAMNVTPGWGPWSEKHGVTYAHAPARALEKIVALRVHLDESDASNGSLRVLPHSHTEGVLTDAQVHERAQRIRPEDCYVSAGGVIVMRPLIIHASSKSSAGKSRAVVHIEYATSLEIEPGMLLRAA
jgi:ectoine hydroxylase-related dioxygenase (phytanoyl-CoA dioxygenase family)